MFATSLPQHHLQMLFLTFPFVIKAALHNPKEERSALKQLRNFLGTLTIVAHHLYLDVVLVLVQYPNAFNQVLHGAGAGKDVPDVDSCQLLGQVAGPQQGRHNADAAAQQPGGQDGSKVVHIAVY